MAAAVRRISVGWDCRLIDRVELDEPRYKLDGDKVQSLVGYVASVPHCGEPDAIAETHHSERERLCPFSRQSYLIDRRYASNALTGGG